MRFSLLFALLLSAGTARAEAPPITRCTPGTPESQAAQAALIPRSIEVKQATAYNQEGMRSGSFFGSSGQTHLSWQWLDDGRLLAKGGLTWPSSSSDAESYAAQLWRVAEAGLQPGCPPSALPPLRQLTNEPPGVNQRDAPAGVAPVHDELLELLGTAPRCTAPPSK